MSRAEQAAFAPRPRVPYLTGVYLAVNAVRDVYLVVDGPNCAFFRIPQVQPNHDWLADLARASGLHRIVDTDATPDRIAREDNRVLLQRLVRVAAQPDCRAILLTPMSIVSLAGRQYEPLLEALDPPLERPLWMVPMGSLSGDWVDGYGAVLKTLAEHIDLESASEGFDEAGIALVGHLHHRNEADAVADGEALRSLVSGLGLRVTSLWLSGGNLEALGEAGRARWVVSLPYGRAAARRLAERTGAQLVELDLPVGLEGTASWLRQLGRATGREAEAEAFLDAQLARVVPTLERVLPEFVAGLRVLVSGDPYLAPALAGALLELGCEVVRVAVLGTEAHREEAARWLTRLGLAAGGLDLVTLTGSLSEGLPADAPDALPFDVVVGSSPAVQMARSNPAPVAVLEVGFPSYTRHALLPEPVLGFDGVLGLAARLGNARMRGASE